MTPATTTSRSSLAYSLSTAGTADPALLVELVLDHVREEVPLEPPRLAAQRVELVEPAAECVPPGVLRIGEQAALHPARQHDAALELLAELRREREAGLVVDRVFVGAEEHSGAGSLPSTLPHFKPLTPTCPPSRPTVRWRREAAAVTAVARGRARPRRRGRRGLPRVGMGVRPPLRGHGPADGGRTRRRELPGGRSASAGGRRRLRVPDERRRVDRRPGRQAPPLSRDDDDHGRHRPVRRPPPLGRALGPFDHVDALHARREGRPARPRRGPHLLRADRPDALHVRAGGGRLASAVGRRTARKPDGSRPPAASSSRSAASGCRRSACT